MPHRFGTSITMPWLLVLTVAAIVMLAACSETVSSNETQTPMLAPEAEFTFTPSTGTAPLDVTFDASASSDADGTIESYGWRFADGTTATGTTTSKRFAAAGTYVVRLIVTDDDGLKDTLQRNIEIDAATTDPANQPPTVDILANSGSGTQTAPATVEFDARAIDPDGTIETVTWTIDGETHTGPTATHTFETAGTHDVSVTVTDDEGATTEGASAYDVLEPGASEPEPEPDPGEVDTDPSADILASPGSGTQTAPATVEFDARAIDPDGTIETVTWTIDGETHTGPTATHTFETAGTHDVSVTVTDDGGASGTDTMTYRVLVPYSFSPTSVVMDMGDPNPTVDVIADGSWSVSSSEAWLVPSRTTGPSGTTAVVLEIDGSELPGGDRASGSLLLVSDDGLHDATLPVTVNLPDFGAASPLQVDLAATVGSGDTGTFGVTNVGRAGMTAHATASASWLSVTPTSTTVSAGGSRQFTVTGTCGTTAQTRTGWIDVSFDDPDEPTVRIDVELTCTEAPASMFAIDLEYYGSDTPTSSQRQAFESAAARWSEVIVGDLASVTASGSQPCSHFSAGTPTLSGTIDDLHIFASVADMDGPGGIVGRAGPCRIRQSSGLPWVGIMEFDRADLANLESNGLLESVILHEMGHVLGIGTLWENGGFDLVDPDCRTGSPSDPRFIGAHATHEHEAAGGVGHAHVEEGYGEGTRCGHWDEEAYGHEVMTGFLSSNAKLSGFTVGSLHDLGYEVDYAAADSYSVLSASGLHAQDAGEKLEEELVFPSGAD